MNAKVSLKLCKKALICIPLALILIIVLSATTNSFLCHQESKDLENAYGHRVQVDGKNMCIDVVGSGDQVVVLLSGWGSPSPVLDLRPLAANLDDKYTVITVEYFGYGLSDDTNNDRSVENITYELHSALKEMGYNNYTLMAHSISGLYGLYYANMYPNEVKSFVGIDTSVANEDDLEASMQESLSYGNMLRTLNNLGIIRLLSVIDPSSIIPEVSGYQRSEEEQELLRKMYLNRLLSQNAMNEMEMLEENCNKLSGMKFPNNVPVLFFISSENVETTSGWKEKHIEQFGNNEKNKLIVFNGSHYLYNEYAPEICNTFKEWDSAELIYQS